MTSFDAFEEEQDRLHKERIDSIRAGGVPEKNEAPAPDTREAEDNPEETEQNPSKSVDSPEIMEKETPSAEVSEEKDGESSSESDFTDEGGDE